LNSILLEALGAGEKEATYIAACAVSRFWDDFLYKDSALDNAKCALLGELDKLEDNSFCRALAVNRIVNSDFWNGNVDNLSKIPGSYEQQISKAVKYIHESSVSDAEYFGAKS